MEMTMVNQKKIEEIREMEEMVSKLSYDISICKNSISRRVLMQEVSKLEDKIRKTRLEAMFK